MSTIGNDLYTSLGLNGSGQASAKKEEALGQADFLRLMTTQLQHQDPLKPMENSAFLGQLAQFSTVQGIQDLSKQVTGFSESLNADQFLRGASLVGHNVLVPSPKVSLDGEGGASGVVAAPGAGSVMFEIKDANGQKVRELVVTTERAGEAAFSWDGTDDSGNRLPDGAYAITATYNGQGTTNKQLDTYVKGKVESVTIGSDGLYLNLPGLGTAPLEYVLRIG